MGLKIYDVVRSQLDNSEIKWNSQLGLSNDVSITVVCPTLVKFSNASTINTALVEKAVTFQVFLDIDECLSLMQDEGYTGGTTNMMNLIEIDRFQDLQDPSERYSGWDWTGFTSFDIVQRTMMGRILRLDGLILA